MVAAALAAPAQARSEAWSAGVGRRTGGGRRTVGQQVNRPATVEVDQDGAVAVAATHREVIHTDDGDRAW